MSTDRRQAGATVMTGAGLLAVGGALRHEGALRAIASTGGAAPRVHINALRRTGAKGRRLYTVGTATGAVGAAGLGTGANNLVHPDVAKADQRPLWREGLAGTGEALRGRADSLTTKAPTSVRATQLGVASAAGAGGSLLGRLALHGASGRTKALVTPVAGALAAAGSVPVSNKIIQRKHKDYTVTPTGVRRTKDVLKRPSSQASQVDPRHGPTRLQVVPTALAKRDYRDAHGQDAMVDMLATNESAYVARRRKLKLKLGRKAKVKTVPSSVAKVRTEDGGNMPLFGRKKWANAGQAQAQAVSDQFLSHYGLPTEPVADIRPRLLRAHRNYFAPRVAAGVAAGGVGAYALNRRRKAKVKTVPSSVAKARKKAKHPERGHWVVMEHQDGPHKNTWHGPYPTAKHAWDSVDGHEAAIDGSTDDLDQIDGFSVHTGLPPWARKPRARGKRQVAKDWSPTVSPGRQRAAILGAGGAPVFGPVLQARQAARYAPPGQERKTAVRQFAAGPVAGLAAGAGGAYGAAHLAKPGSRAEAASAKVMDVHEATVGRAANALKAKLPSGHKITMPGTAALASVKGHRAFALLRKRPVAATAGFLGAKAIVGAVGSNVAISASQRNQRRYATSSAGVAKLDAFGTRARAGRRDEQAGLARRKRRAANLSTVGGVTGLTSVGLLLAGHKQAATTAGIVGSGIGGANALYGARLQRKEATSISPVIKAGSNLGGFGGISALGNLRGVGGYSSRNARKAVNQKTADQKAAEQARASAAGKKAAQASAEASRERRYGQHRAQQAIQRHMNREQNLEKRQPGVAITGTADEHKRLVGQYGAKGPLPKGLDRDTKMRAYEARYVHAGGDKSETWNSRANHAEQARNTSLAVGTAAVAGLAALKHPKVAHLMRAHPRLNHRLDAAALTSAAAGGSAELYGERARARRASYSNSPGGVARSALTRMRAYTPESS